MAAMRFRTFPSLLIITTMLRAAPAFCRPQIRIRSAFLPSIINLLDGLSVVRPVINKPTSVQIRDIL